VLIVEGILVLAHPELRTLFDQKVYVHAPDDVRLIRRIRRDMVSRGRKVVDIMDQWEQTVSPMHHEFVEPSRRHADLVVDGVMTTESMVAAVLGLIGPI
jgi:uridine kinase